MSLGRAAAAIALALLPLLPATPAGAVTGVVVADTPGGRGIEGPLEVEVPADGTALTRTLFLRPAAGTAGGAVALLVDADGPASVELASGTSSGTAITVNLSAGQVPLRVTVASDRAGTSEATVVGRSATGGWSPLLTVSATRAPGPVLVAGAGDAGVAVTSRSGRFAADLPLYAGEAGIADLAATVDPFTSEDGEPVEATWELDAEELEPGGRAVLHVEADLPFGATYRTEVRLAHDGVTDPPVVLTVARERRAASIEVTDAAVERASTGWRTPAVVEHHVAVSETTGRTVQVAVPRLLLHTRGDDAVGDDDARVLRVTDVTPGNEGGDRVLWDAVAGAGDATFAVPGGSTVQLAVVLQLPAAAASNDVTLRFAEDGAAPVDREYTVTVRRSWWWPLLCILAGLALSFLLRHLWREHRGRVALVLPLSRLDEEVRRLRARLAVRGAEEAAVFDGLAAAIRRAAVEVSAGDKDAAEAQVTALALRVRALPAWVDLWRRAVSARPTAVAEPFRERAEVLGQELAGDREPAGAGTPSEAVAALAAEFDAAVGAALAAQVDVLRTDLSHLLGGTARERADALLDRAGALVDGNQPNAAAAAIDEARREAAVALDRQVRGDLADGPHPALAMTDDQWVAATGGVRDALAAARPGWLADAVKPAAALLRVVAEAAEARSAGHPEVAKAVRDARALVDTQPAAARAALAVALDDLHRAQAPEGADLPARAVRAVAAGANGAAPADAVPAVVAGPRAPVAEPDLPTPADLRRRLVRLELAATAVAAVVAVALGMEFLYADDWTWGGAGDVVTALAWGLGIQSLAGGSFTGIPALRDSIVGP